MNIIYILAAFIVIVMGLIIWLECRPVRREDDLVFFTDLKGRKK